MSEKKRREAFLEEAGRGFQCYLDGLKHVAKVYHASDADFVDLLVRLAENLMQSAEAIRSGGHNAELN